MTTELLFGLFLGAAVSGVLPLVNAELLVVGAAALVPPAALPVVALVTAVGQMLTKTVLYGVARWVPAHLPRKARAAVARTSERVSGRTGAMGTLIFGSATVGLPPFYGMSLACGALRVRLATFVASGLAGRLVRFGALAWGGRRAAGALANNAAAAFLGVGGGA